MTSCSSVNESATSIQPARFAAQYPVTAAAAWTAATAYIADLIQRLTPSGSAGGDSLETSLAEVESATRDQLAYLQVNPRSGKAAFNFAIFRVGIRGTTPPNRPPPFTTQAQNCRVYFRVETKLSPPFSDRDGA
jgi:hypothetical protein